MTLPVVFRQAARSELMEAAAWYEARRLDLGSEFLLEIDRCLASIAGQPQLFTIVWKDVRRIAVRRFPYGIYFRAEPRRIVVLAVFHSSRDPTVWRRRR